MHGAKKDRRVPTFIRLVVVPYKVEGVVVEAVNNKKLCYKCSLLSKPENQISHSLKKMVHTLSLEL